MPTRRPWRFIASPEIVMAYGLAGRLSFNPLTDSLETGRWRILEN